MWQGWGGGAGCGRDGVEKRGVAGMGRGNGVWQGWGGDTTEREGVSWHAKTPGGTTLVAAWARTEGTT